MFKLFLLFALIWILVSFVVFTNCVLLNLLKLVVLDERERVNMLCDDVDGDVDEVVVEFDFEEEERDERHGDGDDKRLTMFEIIWNRI